jgi:hypothetical protein
MPTMARMGAIAGGADLCDDTLAAVARLAGDGAVPLLSAAAASAPRRSPRSTTTRAGTAPCRTGHS